MVPPELVRGVKLLCLDAGNTIVFLDHGAVADIARSAGVDVDASAIERAEGAAKRLLDDARSGRAEGVSALAGAMPAAEIGHSWGTFVRAILRIASGRNDEAYARELRALWDAHREFNLWRRVPDGLPEALRELRAAGVPVCVVSNSEGKLSELFQRLGILDAFDRVVDSHHVGVEKPDPRIFDFALQPFGIAPEQALHLGDVVAMDVVGARARGVRAALIDPFGHYEGQHPDVIRVPSAAAVARALTEDRRRARS